MPASPLALAEPGRRPRSGGRCVTRGAQHRRADGRRGSGRGSRARPLSDPRVWVGRVVDRRHRSSIYVRARGPPHRPRSRLMARPGAHVRSRPIALDRSMFRVIAVSVGKRSMLETPKNPATPRCGSLRPPYVNEEKHRRRAHVAGRRDTRTRLPSCRGFRPERQLPYRQVSSNRPSGSRTPR